MPIKTLAKIPFDCRPKKSTLPPALAVRIGESTAVGGEDEENPAPPLRELAAAPFLDVSAADAVAVAVAGAGG